MLKAVYVAWYSLGAITLIMGSGKLCRGNCVNFTLLRHQLNEIAILHSLAVDS